MAGNQEAWDEYIERLANSGNVGELFIEHLELVHDTISTAQRIADSRFGPKGQCDKDIVLTITQWILSGPKPWEGLNMGQGKLPGHD